MLWARNGLTEGGVRQGHQPFLRISSRLERINNYIAASSYRSIRHGTVQRWTVLFRVSSVYYARSLEPPSYGGYQARKVHPLPLRKRDEAGLRKRFGLQTGRMKALEHSLLYSIWENKEEYAFIWRIEEVEWRKVYKGG